MTDDMAAFISARLGEDEAAAMAAAKVEPEDTETSRWYGHAHWVARYGTVVDAEDDDYAMITGSTDEVCAHIARHDPGRALREVAAMRAILALHPFEVVKRPVTPFNPYTGEPQPDEYDATCGICGWFDPGQGGCQTIRTLAAVWNDHPDYRAGWKP